MPTGSQTDCSHCSKPSPLQICLDNSTNYPIGRNLTAGVLVIQRRGSKTQISNATPGTN